MRVGHFLVLALMVALSGCMSQRFKTNLPATTHDVSHWAGMKFYVAEVDKSGLVQKAQIHEQLTAFQPAVLQEELVKTYPQLFVNDPSAVPLRVVISGLEDDNSPVGPMLTGFTMGVIPFPDVSYVKARVRVEVLLTGGQPLPGPVETSFETKRVMYMSLVGPLGIIPVIGPSDAPRQAMFFFIPLTKGVYSTQLPSRDLAIKATTESIMRGLDSLDVAAVRTAQQSRQKQLRVVDLGGRRLHLLMNYGNSQVKDKLVETAFVNVYEQEPTINAKPMAVIPVATREAGAWTTQRGMLYLSDQDYQVSALLENGVPMVPVAQRTELQLEDLIRTPSNLEGVQWSNSRLLALKNERWPQEIQTMSAEMVVERITRLENAIMENSASIERANDAAQDAIAKGGDPRESREWAIFLRQRIEILKALLMPLKSR